jgi:O-antigen/teichoic acid export membrane protein
VNLRHAASRGVKFTAFATLSTTLIQVGGLLVLGRLLSPIDFGLVAMMAVVFGLADMFAQMGIGEGIVQHQAPLDTGQLSTLFWTNCALGVAAYLLILLCIPLVAAVYGEPALRELLPVASIAIVIAPLGINVAALLRKSLRFEVLAAVDIGKAVVGTGTAIVAALLGWGVWALIAGQISATACGTAALLAVGAREGWLPRLRYDLRGVRGILSFGVYFFGSNLVNYVNSRIDLLLVGSLLGARALGYYSMAFNLVVQPAARINQIVTQVAFPIMARAQQETAQLRRWYAKMLNMLATVNAPALLGMAAVAPLFIPLLLGEKWLPAVPLVQLLAVLALFRSAGNAGGTLIYALGKARVAFYWNLCLLLLIPAAVFFGAHLHGLLGVALTLTAMQAILFLAWFGVVRRHLSMPFGDYALPFARPTLLAVAMAAAVSYAGGFLQDWPAAGVLAALVAGAIVAYAVLYRLLFRAEFDEYIAMILLRSTR